MAKAERLLDKGDVATVLKISISGVDKILARNKRVEPKKRLRVTRVSPKAVRFQPRHVRAFIAQQTES